VLDPIMHTLTQLNDVMMAHWPKLVATLLILIVGWILAKIFKMGIGKGLKLIKLDVVSEKAGIEGFLKKGGMKQTAVDLLASLVYWIAIIIVLMMVLHLWKIDIGLSTTLVPFLPKVFAALVILIMGLFIASLIEDLVRATSANAGLRYSFILSKLLKWILIVFVVMTAIQQLGIQTEFLSIGFLIILGSVGLGLALAIGLGAKDVVGKRIENWLVQLEQEAKAVDDSGAAKTD
jgi:small-conductance mechanosensitive channel